MEASREKILNGNSSYKQSTNDMKTVETSDGKKAKPYRLTVRINKIYLRPCPKSKKINQININSGSTQKKVEEKLQNLKCLVCKKESSTISELYEHVKEHFICDICNTEFSSQKSIKKHCKIHQSETPRKPYRCHVCEQLFATKEEIKNHSHIRLDKYNEIDDSRIQYCKTCNMSFRNDTVFRKHLASHVEKVSDVQVENQMKPNSVPLQMPTFGQLRPVLFNCRICNQNFHNLIDIDKHTKTHVQEFQSMNEK